jgi:hypothetical protein
MCDIVGLAEQEMITHVQEFMHNDVIYVKFHFYRPL